MKFTVGFITGIVAVSVLVILDIAFHLPLWESMVVALVVSLVLNLGGRYIADKVDN